MWFYIKPTRSRAHPSPIYLQVQHVNHYKYFGMHFDSQLKWDVHVANTCKKMSYYLYLIIITINSCCHIFLRCWQTPLYFPVVCSSLGLVQHLGCSISAIMLFESRGLKKHDHVLAAHHSLGWLPFHSLVQLCTLNLMYCHYTHADFIQLNPPFQFGPNHSYETRWSLHFVTLSMFNIIWMEVFRSQATTWRNHLPHSLFDCSPIDFQIICMNIYLICEY